MLEQIDAHLEVARALTASVSLLEEIARRIVHTFSSGGRLYLVGNGGSAADAQHIAAEFVGRFKLDRRPLPAIALTTDTSGLTAIGNDLGAEVIFARQVEGLVNEKDIVWALSVSGRSPNIIAAVQAARRRGATVIGFTSTSGDALAELADCCLQVSHTDSDRVQEVHVLAYHLICERVEAAFAEAE
jgi:D-sedoheptulose 7-phosphate isomerase